MQLLCVEIEQDVANEIITGPEYDTNGEGQEDISADLRLLNERADILSKELKQINLKMVNELEEDYHSLIDKLKYSGAPVDARSKNQELLDKISGSKTKAKEKELTYE